MSWVTIDTGLVEHPKMAGLPSDGARYGWLVVVCAAKRQRKPGTFAGRRHAKEVLGRHARFLPAYIDVGLLDEAPDGSLAVHDWSKYQRDPTNAERQARHRRDSAVTSNGDVTEEVTDDVTPLARAPALSLSLSMSNNLDNDGRKLNEEEGSGGKPDPLDVAQRWLAGRRAAVPPGSKTETDLARLVDQHGAEAVIAAMGRLPQPLHDGAQYVYGARKALNPIPDPKAVAASEREAQEKAKSERAVAATRRYIDQLTGGAS